MELPHGKKTQTNYYCYHMLLERSDFKYSDEPELPSCRIMGLIRETQKLRPTRKGEIGKDFNWDDC